MSYMSYKKTQKLRGADTIEKQSGVSGQLDHGGGFRARVGPKGGHST